MGFRGMGAVLGGSIGTSVSVFEGEGGTAEEGGQKEPAFEFLEGDGSAVEEGGHRALVYIPNRRIPRARGLPIGHPLKSRRCRSF